MGNRRHVVVSDQSGRANILARFREIGLAVDADDPKIATLVETVKAREYDGYAYDGAEASFELLARRALGQVPEFFKLARFRVMDDRRWNARSELVTESEATITVEVGEDRLMTVATGNGPVNALDTALRKALLPFYPELEDMRLVDFKVRILTPNDGTEAVTRVMIESADRTASAGPPSASPPTSSTLPSTRCTTPSPGSCSAPAPRRQSRRPRAVSTGSASAPKTHVYLLRQNPHHRQSPRNNLWAPSNFKLPPIGQSPADAILSLLRTCVPDSFPFASRPDHSPAHQNHPAHRRGFFPGKIFSALPDFDGKRVG